MTREYYLRSLISDNGSLKDFAIKIGMPYSTLLSILKNVGGAACDNVFKICQGLGISADSLSMLDKIPSNVILLELTPAEQQHIKKYRKLSPAGKKEVDHYLDFRLSAEAPRVEKDTEMSSS